MRSKKADVFLKKPSMTTPEKSPVFSRADALALAAGAGLVILTITQNNRRNFGEALLASTVFAVGGYVLRGVNFSGALAGFAVAFAFYATGAAPLFLLLFAAFLVTFIATQIGRGRKVHLGIAEPARGRNAAQVMANLAVSGCCVAMSERFPHLLPAGIAALAEACGDTTSSEIGEAFGKRPRMITSFDPAEPGTDGAISLVGTLAGLVGIAAVLFQVGSGWRVPMTIGAAALVGTVVDSFLGATVERKRWIGNNLVNLCGTTAAAIVTLLLFAVAR